METRALNTDAWFNWKTRGGVDGRCGENRESYSFRVVGVDDGVTAAVARLNENGSSTSLSVGEVDTRVDSGNGVDVIR